MARADAGPPSVLLLPTSVTHRDARGALGMLLPALKREPDDVVAVDASGLAQFDSAVLAVLLECRRLASAWGKGFVVLNAPARLVQLARLYGLEEAVSLKSASGIEADRVFAETVPLT